MFDPEQPDRYRPPYASLPPEWRDAIYGPPAKETLEELLAEFKQKLAVEEKRKTESPPDSGGDSGVG